MKRGVQFQYEFDEKSTSICVPGGTEDRSLPTDAADSSSPEKRSPKRARLGTTETTDKASGEPSTSDQSFPCAEETAAVEDPLYPPEIDFRFEEAEANVTVIPFEELRSKPHFVDKTDLIRDILMTEYQAKYYCFPRGASKTTVMSALVLWLSCNNDTREDRLNCFRDTKIYNLAKEKDQSLSDGTLGFNGHTVIAADFSEVEVNNCSSEDVEKNIAEAFINYVHSEYPIPDEVIQRISQLSTSSRRFFSTLIDHVAAAVPGKKNSAVLIIDNFDAPVLRILNQANSFRLAQAVMSFLNRVMQDLSRAISTKYKLFYKIILFGTHQPIGMKSMANLRKISTESYPFGSKNVCSKFFFSASDVESLLEKSHKDTNKMEELSKLCGQYLIYGQNYYHPGCIINYVKSESDAENQVYWCSADSLDILADTSVSLKYEMSLWTLRENEKIIFKYKKVLMYENIASSPDIALTYFLQGGYLTPIQNTNPIEYKIVNHEVRRVFIARFQKWCERKPALRGNEALRQFESEKYFEFFSIANNILKTCYAGEDFRFEGQYHVFLASFFHDDQNWHFQSNIQAGYGKCDFIAWDKRDTVEVGYVFEMAILKPEKTDTVDLVKKKIAAKIIEKKNQIHDRQYFLAVKKKTVMAVVVIGCRKMMSYTVFKINPVSR